MGEVEEKPVYYGQPNASVRFHYSARVVISECRMQNSEVAEDSLNCNRKIINRLNKLAKVAYF